MGNNNARNQQAVENAEEQIRLEKANAERQRQQETEAFEARKREREQAEELRRRQEEELKQKHQDQMKELNDERKEADKRHTEEMSELRKKEQEMRLKLSNASAEERKTIMAQHSSEVKQTEEAHRRRIQDANEHKKEMETNYRKEENALREQARKAKEEQRNDEKKQGEELKRMNDEHMARVQSLMKSIESVRLEGYNQVAAIEDTTMHLRNQHLIGLGNVGNAAELDAIERQVCDSFRHLREISADLQAANSPALLQLKLYQKKKSNKELVETKLVDVGKILNKLTSEGRTAKNLLENMGDTVIDEMQDFFYQIININETIQDLNEKIGDIRATCEAEEDLDGEVCDFQDKMKELLRDLNNLPTYKRKGHVQAALMNNVQRINNMAIEGSNGDLKAIKDN